MFRHSSPLIALALLLTANAWAAHQPGHDTGKPDSPGEQSRRDTDRDGVPDNQDSCPATPNSGQDADQDGTDDACDELIDSDGDGIADEQDSCPGTPNQGVDRDADGIDAACDADDGSAGDAGPGRVSAEDDPAAAARAAEAIVLTGADIPDWSVARATGQPMPPDAGYIVNQGIRSAHHGYTVAAPGVAGVDVGSIVAYRFADGNWTEIPVQVDEVMPYFLVNYRSDFGMYSNTDTEYTYAWGAHATGSSTTGEEAWRKVAGKCTARYPRDLAEINELIAAGVITIGVGEEPADYLGPTADPVAGLDDDDEIAFLAADAGEQAPAGNNPDGVTAGSRHEVMVTSPLTGTTRYVYLFLDERGSSFDWTNGHVEMAWGTDSNRWIDRNSFAANDPQKIGSSNTGYGANLTGTVCDPNGVVRASSDRFPIDDLVVRTDSYRLTASGRWMIRGMQVAGLDSATKATGVPHAQRNTRYGADLLDRWKGRAFQQSPDSEVSLVGFEDEQVNWEANAALLGWRQGPVRAIREVWGADSGTNVTKTETFYRDLVQYRYRVRVHPIPSDGLYTSWDYNAGAAYKYYNTLKMDGVDIDGENDDMGNIDEVAGYPAFFDAPDPTFDLPSAMYRWEQVAGRDDLGSLVYSFDITGPTTLANGDVVPYYRDDMCLDDGTGDDPVQRPFPGDNGTSEKVQRAYAEAAGLDFDAGERADCNKQQTQGAFGAHGLHFFFAPESDNLFLATGVPVNEIDGRQWQFAVPLSAPVNVGAAYGNVVRLPSVVVVTPQATP